MMKKNIDRDLNVFRSFSDEVTSFKFKNNLRIILGSKLEKVKSIEALLKADYSYKICVMQ